LSFRDSLPLPSLPPIIFFSFLFSIFFRCPIHTTVYAQSQSPLSIPPSTHSC
jgi:hypothetical protein